MSNTLTMNPPTHQDGWDVESDLREILGVYQPMQFVVRLHPSIHDQLDRIPTGVHVDRNLSGSAIFAFSTYFHETIHWWQHTGSTFGLIISLCYPAQAHVNHARLRWLLDRVGPVKSLLTFRETAPSLSSEVERELNIVLNNWHDIEYCRRIALVPPLAESIVREQYFDSIGHGYSMTWASCVSVIAASVDPKRTLLPDVNDWEGGFHDLRLRRVDGYHRETQQITLIATGARLLFEGQARFSQLEYLHHSSGGKVDWEGFEDLGMLNGDYVTAFRWFLELVERPWPASVQSPEVALFLALSDIALNPGEGFPFGIRRFHTFIEDVDPGIRFFRLCVAARSRLDDLLMLVIDHSAEGYVAVAGVLCEAIAWRSPVEIWQDVRGWVARSAAAAALVEEDRTFRFSPGDLPVRVFVGRFMAFQRAKAEHPHFFVWPGFHSVAGHGSGLSIETVKTMFAEHEPLFNTTPAGEIRPTLIPGRSEADISAMFNDFYCWCASYDLIRQWHVEDGPFSLDYGWITPTATDREMRTWASTNFRNVFGVFPKDFTTL